MNINTWSPNNDGSTSSLDAHTISLQAYIEIGASDSIESTIDALPENTIALVTPLIKQDINFWQIAAEKLSSENIIHLIRFFTLAEEKHSALFAGNDSSVIALNKLLKLRKTPLSKNELLWIKAHTSNRYLPNGSIL
jgi:hypothetical protein